MSEGQKLKIKSCMIDNNSRFEKTEIETDSGVVTFTQRPMTAGEHQISMDEARVSEVKYLPDPNDPTGKNVIPEVYVRTKSELLNLLRILFSLGGEYNGEKHKIGNEGWTIDIPVNMESVRKLHPQLLNVLGDKAISLNSFDEAERKN